MNLDDDIAAWAAAARLAAADADAIFRRIVVTPIVATPIVATQPAGAVTAPAAHVLATTAPGLDPAWWRRYTAGFAAGMVASTAPLRHAA
jgi:hypothetical protein